MDNNHWLEADRRGLAKQAKERGAGFIVVELVSNALDEKFSGVNNIDVSVEPLPNRSLATICVEDNSPRGYGDYLPHAYTLFTESYKRENPEQSG